MKIIEPSYEIVRPNIHDPDAFKAIYGLIEEAGRTCYRSEEKITDTSGEKFTAIMAKNRHEAMLEHAHMTVRFVVDRGVSHELVRHRMASFAQESQRYCAYNKAKFDGQVSFIRPFFFDQYSSEYFLWKNAMKDAEHAYLTLLDKGVPPEQARTVLPNSTRTEIVITANMREWRHIFSLRAAGETGRPHPQMLQIMIPLLLECQMYLPSLFGDIVIPEEYLEIIK